MSAPEPNPMDITGVAVAVGRIELGQQYMQVSVDKVDVKVDGLATTVGAHAIHLEKNDGRLDAHDSILASRAPIRSPWPLTAAFAISAAALVVTIIQAFVRP